jgi:histidyl-tRNA synthetase
MRWGARALSGGGGGGRGSAAAARGAGGGGAAKAAAPKLSTRPPRGTRDFPPQLLRQRAWLFGHFRETARLHGFEEYDAPVLESEALFARKSGDEIVEQLYAFADRGGRRLALRPEMTPSLARMVLSQRAAMAPGLLPLKWFSLPQCWRYERMSRGRRREHYQWNMDVWGLPGAAAEAELLSALVTLLGRVRLTPADVRVRLSSRQALGAALSGALALPPPLFAPACLAVDALGKRGEAATREALAAVLSGALVAPAPPPPPPGEAGGEEGEGAATDTATDTATAAAAATAAALEAGGWGFYSADDAARMADAVLRVASVRGAAEQATLDRFDATVGECAAAVLGGAGAADAAAAATGAPPPPPPSAALRELLSCAEAYGASPWLELDFSIVRGLQYYTGTVFEAFDTAGELRAIVGGGRYDTLLSTLTGSARDDVPAAGFGFGDAVIAELLGSKGLLPSDGELARADGPDAVVFAWGGELRVEAIALATRLRALGLAVDLELGERRAKAVFKSADRRCARHVVMLAPEEWAAKTVRVKSMGQGSQLDVPLGELEDLLLRQR